MVGVSSADDLLAGARDGEETLVNGIIILVIISMIRRIDAHEDIAGGPGYEPLAGVMEGDVVARGQVVEHVVVAAVAAVVFVWRTAIRKQLDCGDVVGDARYLHHLLEASLKPDCSFRGGLEIFKQYFRLCLRMRHSAFVFCVLYFAPFNHF